MQRRRLERIWTKTLGKMTLLVRLRAGEPTRLTELVDLIRSDDRVGV
jgi:hypothetical protein